MTAAALRRSPRWTAAILGAWRWRTSALAVAIGLATLAFNGTPLAWPLGSAENYVRTALFNMLQFGFPLVFLVQLADRATDAGARPLLAYAAAVIGTGLAGVWPLAILLRPVVGIPGLQWGPDDDVRLMVGTLPFHGLCVGAYAKWRGERLARERLQAVERARAEEQRRLDTSRLLALQSKVEPQLLFDALARIDAALAGDDDLADQRLADLIALLRALQPSLRDAATTLERELALILAHARVTGEAGLGPGRLAFEMGDGAAQARLAPVVLLPLLRWLTAARPAGWRVRADADGGRLCIEARADGGEAAAAPLPPLVDELRGRLVAVHGPGARLLVDPRLAHLWLDTGVAQ